MTTTKEFKTLHSLSDSAFNRLTNKIKAAYPDQELTRRINNRDWKIIDVALFEQYLTPQKVEVVEVASTTSQVTALDLTVINSPSTENGDRYALSLNDRQQNLDTTRSNGEAIESVLNVAEQLIQGMQGYRQHLENQTDVSKTQVLELKQKQFELTAELELTQESEARHNVQQRAVNADLGKYSGNVVSLADRLKRRVQ